MESSTSSHTRNQEQESFFGIGSPGKRRQVDESAKLFDVFINHRGPDVKKTVALWLYDSLKEFGIHAFLDSEEKELGDSFPSTIENAIHSAKVHIAIFSKGYAESPWCLAELVLMLKSRAKIIPVFYRVKPSVLRFTDKGEYAKAFTGYEEKKRYMEKLKEWKEALQTVSLLAGHEISGEFSFSDCQKIVSAVRKQVQRKEPLHVAKYPLGLDRVVKDFERQCSINHGGKGETQIVGIYGMGGVGKTTLAKELFNRKRSEYTQTCFLFDVREAYADNKFTDLQKELLKDLFQKENLNIHCKEQGTSHIGGWIRRSNQLNFLLVLDDIDHLEQLDALLIRDILTKSENSLVIVTTRDAGVLKNAGITVRYNLQGMRADQAKELFCCHAFSQPYPSSGYENLVDLFVDECRGLPLSLQVMGSHVHGEDEKYWESELENVKKILPEDIHKRLSISTNRLDKEEKEIFMDVACFLIGESEKNAIRVWERSGWSAQRALQRLKNKCLVEEVKSYKFGTRNHFSEVIVVLRMHDHLRDLGRQMADDLNHPHRLWRSKDLQFLESKGFKSILTQPKFRYLHYFKDPSMGCHIKYFLGELGNTLEQYTALLWLELKSCCHELPSIHPWIPLQDLQYLVVKDGSLERLWQNNEQAPLGLKELRIYNIWRLEELSLGLLRCLDVLVIHSCLHLKCLTGMSELKMLVKLNILGCYELEDLSLVRLSCLKEITIVGCGHLKSVTASDLTKLLKMDIFECRELQQLSLVRLNSAEYVKIGNCSHLKCLTGISDLTNLQNLSIHHCGELEELSLVQLSCLKEITIVGCCHLKSVRASDLKKLVKFDILKCVELQELSLVRLNSAEYVKIGNCSHLKCLTGISDLTNLENLSIHYCGELEELSLVQLSCLKEITIVGCCHLKSVRVSDLIKLVKLDIFECGELQELSFICLSSLKSCSISGLLSLERIEMKGCKKLISIKEASFKLGTQSTYWKLVKLNIYDCPKLKKIPIEMYHLLERVEILNSRNRTFQKFVPNMKKLPSNFIKVIGQAVDGAESTLNADLFCDFNSANSVIQIGTEARWNHLGRHMVSAIIYCAVVQIRTPAAAKRINDFIWECDIDPWLKCKVREGQWIITSVTSKQDEMDRHIVNKGKCFPFDYIFFEGAMVRSLTFPVMRGEEHKVLNALRRVVDTLYQK